jgi:hypothetical protein
MPVGGSQKFEDCKRKRGKLKVRKHERDHIGTGPDGRWPPDWQWEEWVVMPAGGKPITGDGRCEGEGQGHHRNGRDD